jgi:hypothetical protein
MWTFTFAAVLDVKATRKKWNHLLTLLKRRWPKLAGLRVFELHKNHGLHVHLVTNRWIDVNVARELAFLAGWGRIHVMRIPPERASYLAKYLSKDRPECLKGWRSRTWFSIPCSAAFTGRAKRRSPRPGTRTSGTACGSCSGWKFGPSARVGRRAWVRAISRTGCAPRKNC